MTKMTSADTLYARLILENMARELEAYLDDDVMESEAGRMWLEMNVGLLRRHAREGLVGVVEAGGDDAGDA